MLVPWEFQLLPPEEYENIIKLYDAQDYLSIALLYRKYRVMPRNICPSCAYILIKEQTKNAIDLKFKVWTT